MFCRAPSVRYFDMFNLPCTYILRKPVPCQQQHSVQNEGEVQKVYNIYRVVMSCRLWSNSVKELQCDSILINMRLSWRRKKVVAQYIFVVFIDLGPNYWNINYKHLILIKYFILNTGHRFKAIGCQRAHFEIFHRWITPMYVIFFINNIWPDFVKLLDTHPNTVHKFYSTGLGGLNETLFFIYLKFIMLCCKSTLYSCFPAV